MTDAELDEILLHRWPILLRRVMVEGDDWSRQFVRSIARHGKRRGWRPSPKQAALMRRMLAEMALTDEPGSLIEDAT